MFSFSTASFFQQMLLMMMVVAYVSEDHIEEASAGDPSGSSAESEVPSSEDAMNNSNDRE